MIPERCDVQRCFSLHVMPHPDDRSVRGGSYPAFPHAYGNEYAAHTPSALFGKSKKDTNWIDQHPTVGFFSLSTPLRVAADGRF